MPLKETTNLYVEVFSTIRIHYLIQSPKSSLNRCYFCHKICECGCAGDIKKDFQVKQRTTFFLYVTHSYNRIKVNTGSSIYLQSTTPQTYLTCFACCHKFDHRSIVATLLIVSITDISHNTKRHHELFAIRRRPCLGIILACICSESKGFHPLLPKR